MYIWKKKYMELLESINKELELVLIEDCEQGGSFDNWIYVFRIYRTALSKKLEAEKFKEEENNKK